MCDLCLGPAAFISGGPTMSQRWGLPSSPLRISSLYLRSIILCLWLFSSVESRALVPSCLACGSSLQAGLPDCRLASSGLSSRFRHSLVCKPSQPTLLPGSPLLGPHRGLAMWGSRSDQGTPRFCWCLGCLASLCFSKSYSSQLTCFPHPQKCPQCSLQTFSWLDKTHFSKLLPWGLKARR